MNVLLVGEAPGKGGGTGDVVLGGRIGRRLARLMGISVEDYERRFERVNLLSYWPGRGGGSGSTWDMRAARSAARHMEDEGLYRAERRVVLLGRRVAVAFGLSGVRWFGPSYVGKAIILVAPHPSGASRWWNDPRNVARARRFWRILGKGAL